MGCLGPTVLHSNRVFPVHTSFSIQNPSNVLSAGSHLLWMGNFGCLSCSRTTFHVQFMEFAPLFPI